jgi:transducin (beta)-like 1
VVIGNSATENPLTHSIESNLNCLTVAWMSHNQLACGYDDGTFEIHEIELNNSQMESRMVQKIRHDFGDHGLCRFIISITDFKLIKRAYVSTIAINKELDLLASSGTDQRIEVS